MAEPRIAVSAGGTAWSHSLTCGTASAKSTCGPAEQPPDEPAAAGAILGTVFAGPVGGAVGAGLGPKLRRLVRGVWAELSKSARQRQTDVLFWAIRAGVPVDEMEARINASKRTELLTGIALDAACQTAWEDKVRTLGRSLASGLLADDNPRIDTEQMIIAAIADIESPHLAMLELLVARRPARNVAEPLISGPLKLPEESHWRPYDDNWDVAWREWPRGLIAHARPNLAPIAPTLLGTLQRHGLVVQNQNTDETIELSAASDLKQEPTWSPTELGEQVFLRFHDAGTDLDDVWSSGLADQQE